MSAKTEKSETSDAVELPELAANEVCRTLRRYAPDGADELHGVFRVPFEFGDNRASLFVPFCPAFEFDPAIEFEQVGGPDGSVKLAGCFPHGMRLEIKCDHDSNDSDDLDDVVLQVFARAQANG